MELDNLLESVISGNCTLFTGAGFSFGAKNIHGNLLASAASLTEKLYLECGVIENDYDLKNASQFYIEEFGEHQLIEFLRNNFFISEVSNSHLSVASLPWKRVYTTNYDNVLELAYSKSGKLLSSIVLGDKIDQYRDKRTYAIHLNGYIDKLIPSSLYKDFKLTDVSYLTTDFINSQWVDLFRSDIETSKVVVFIGFSLNSDLDLSRIILAKAKKDKIAFIVKENESKLLTQKLSRFGNVFEIGIDGFAQMLEMKKTTFSPSENDDIIYRSFSKFEINSSPVKIKDTDVFDLLFKGNFNSNLIHYSITNSSDFVYYIKRKEIEEVAKYIEQGGKNILIHSDLGNGKTLFLEGLSDTLVNMHYEVFTFVKYYDQTDLEIEQICRKSKKAAIIVEKYSDNLQLLKTIALFRTSDIVLIVSDRSTINDTVYVALEQSIFSNVYLTKNLNNLSLSEIEELTKLLNKYGLWGKYASNDVEKRKVIVDKCKSSFRLLLLYLLDSPDIKKRFNDILLFIESANESYFDAALLILASTVFDFKIDVDNLVYILDDELLNNPSFNNNDYLKEFVNFGNLQINVRSSILALSLLSQAQYHKKLISLLIKVFLKLDKRSIDKNNYQILKSLVSFSRLQSIFNLHENNHFRSVVLNFYEEIKGTRFAIKNPFFWLQYAIARLSAREYLIADKYFNTAYSYANKNPDFDTFQIDNHYARHVLENEIYNGTEDTCMEQFIKAHNLLSVKSSLIENRHYPIRVAINYGKFYDRYFNILSVQDQRVFIISCEEIMQKIIEYKLSVERERWNKAIYNCERELTRILEKHQNSM
ncbi:SIR2 family protein [Sphingobacterium sp. LRF_L2]|uniref:SIR2 family protein n=1 Tax=Sphingobacterium sp. LRF_L2 TaxID=3369421 RepID=UPI003F5DD6E5